MKKYQEKMTLNKIKLNILAAGSLVVGLFNFVLIYFTFGKSEQADLYFLITNGINILFLLVESLVSNYAYEFRMLRTSEHKRSAYTTMLFSASAFSIFLSLLFLLGYGEVYELIFDGGINDSGREIFCFFIHVCGLYLITQVNTFTLNAIDKIGLGYIVSFIPQFALFISLFGIAIGVMEPNVEIIFIALALGYVFSAVFSLYLCSSYVGFSLRFERKFLYFTCKKSLKSRSAANVHSVFLNYFIVSIMSGTNSGAASTFYYGKRIAEMFHLVIYGPLGKQMINTVSDSWVAGDYKSFTLTRYHIIHKVPLAYIATLILLLSVLWLIIDVLKIISLDFNELAFVLFMYFMIHVVILLESLYSLISLLTANFFKIFVANLFFVFILTVSQFFASSSYSSVHLLCFSILVGQLGVLGCHYLLNRELIKKHYKAFYYVR